MFSPGYYRLLIQSKEMHINLWLYIVPWSKSWVPVHVNPVTNCRAVQTKGVTLQLAPLLDSPRLAEQDVRCGRSSRPAGERFLICSTWNHAAFTRSFWSSGRADSETMHGKHSRRNFFFFLWKMENDAIHEWILNCGWRNIQYDSETRYIAHPGPPLAKCESGETVQKQQHKIIISIYYQYICMCLLCGWTTNVWPKKM